jgi:hypothetical protein
MVLDIAQEQVAVYLNQVLQKSRTFGWGGGASSHANKLAEQSTRADSFCVGTSLYLPRRSCTGPYTA